jgi:membrane protein DedA with SNARE-associated domain
VDIAAQIAQYRYLAMFGILFIGALGVPIPEEPVLIASGLAVGWGEADFLKACLACVAGILAGDIFVFAMGRYYAARFLSVPPFKWIFTRRRQVRIRELFRKHGNKTIFMGRFIPAIRFGVLVFAGQHKVPWSRFLLLDVSAAAVSGPLVVWIGKYAAEKMGDPEKAGVFAQKLARDGAHWIYGAIALVAVYFVIRHLRARKASKAGSRNRRTG